MKSARVLHHPKPIRPLASQPLALYHSYIASSREEIKYDNENQTIRELAEIESEINQSRSTIRMLEIFKRKLKQLPINKTVPRRPKNPMIRDKEFNKKMCEIDTESSIDLECSYE